MRFLILNGPNLNLLGKRNPEVYGDKDFEGILKAIRDEFPSHRIDYYQSNVEGEIINELQRADGKYHAIILNAGGYTHTSVAIGDTVEAIDCPVIEVHISNIYAREEFRHISYISPHAKGVIAGLGPDVYLLAVESLVR
ncbi:MAG: type II 3-dehydroquinate dehydratase [Bacteroidales bacterium]|jgi:3-dehydroquinate dehydratase-2|nr:type II 3-dehydroquinate dehydratase [Bacteroidales bacterium]